MDKSCQVIAVKLTYSALVENILFRVQMSVASERFITHQNSEFDLNPLKEAKSITANSSA